MFPLSPLVAVVAVTTIWNKNRKTCRQAGNDQSGKKCCDESIHFEGLCMMSSNNVTSNNETAITASSEAPAAKLKNIRLVDSNIAGTSLVRACRL